MMPSEDAPEHPPAFKMNKMKCKKKVVSRFSKFAPLLMGAKKQISLEERGKKYSDSAEKKKDETEETN